MNRAKLAGLLASLFAVAASSHANLVAYDDTANSVTFDTSTITGWLTDGAVAGVAVGAILFGIGMGVAYLIRFLKRTGK